MRVLIDMDGIVADLLDKWLRVYNAEWGDDLKPDGIKTWDTHKYVKPECGKAVYAILMRPGFFRDLVPIRGALKAVAALRQMNHQVRFCTATPGPDAAACKLEWAYEHFGMRSGEVIMTHEKQWVGGDMIIDDKPKTLLQWQGVQGGLVVGIEYPYNAHVASEIDFLAPSYRNPAGAWAQIVSFVEARTEPD